MGYRSKLSLIVEATPDELSRCITEFHTRLGDTQWVWGAVTTIGKTLFTRLELQESVSELGDYCWQVIAKDVMAPEQPPEYCIITATPLPGWINQLGDVLELNFWPDWNEYGGMPDAQDQICQDSYRKYLGLFLHELLQRRMIARLPDWINIAGHAETSSSVRDTTQDADGWELAQQFSFNASATKVYEFLIEQERTRTGGLENLSLVEQVDTTALCSFLLLFVADGREHIRDPNSVWASVAEITLSQDKQDECVARLYIDPSPVMQGNVFGCNQMIMRYWREVVVDAWLEWSKTLTQDTESDTGKEPRFVNTILSRIDKLENNLGGKLDDLKQGEIAIYRRIDSKNQAILETIWEEIHQQRMEQGEIQSILDAIRRVLKHVQETGFSVADPAITQSLADIYEAVNSDLSFRQQLELSIPVIPFLLEYKVGLDAGVDLGAVWKELVERVQKSQGEHKSKVDYRRERIRRWREAIGTFNFRNERFGGTVWYSELRPYLQEDVVKRIEAPRTFIVPAEKRSGFAEKDILLDEISRIEREWDLL